MSLLVFLALGPAGAAGAVARYLLDQAVSSRTRQPGLGIATINTLACLLLGVAAAHLDRDTTAWALVTTGFLGGFSTFSTAVLDIATTWRTRPLHALALAGGGLAAAALAFLAGWTLGS